VAAGHVIAIDAARKTPEKRSSAACAGMHACKRAHAHTHMHTNARA
jgi:sulfite reductase beta subunit-like hemoprotein